jgi:hypothetical protein
MSDNTRLSSVLHHEPTVKELDFETVHNVCHYLKNNNLTSDSYFMLFKTLMA